MENFCKTFLFFFYIFLTNAAMENESEGGFVESFLGWYEISVKSFEFQTKEKKDNHFHKWVFNNNTIYRHTHTNKQLFDS